MMASRGEFVLTRPSGSLWSVIHMVAGRQVFRHPSQQPRSYILDKWLAFHPAHFQSRGSQDYNEITTSTDIPRRADESDLALDSKVVTERTYEALRAARRIRYDQPPEPPLVGAAAAWADQLLRDRGLR